MTEQSVAAIDRKYEWDETQLAAIERCCDMSQRIVPITGVAGTGKTTLIREVYIVLQEAGYTCVLCAPTGKAAKRIQEATGIPAMTIHRLLEYPHPGERDPDTGVALSSTIPKRDKRNPVLQQVILCDEYAMVNREVHRNLIDALPPAGRVCMFGDVNQLKPIEQGRLANKPSPFETALKMFDGTVLEVNHRIEEGSGIAENGSRILKGNIPKRESDFILKITNQPVKSLTEIVLDMLMVENINFGSNQGQIISCMKNTWVGTYKLNLALQDMLNPIPAKQRVRLERHTWDTKLPIRVGVGDKVIWTENSYDLRNPWDRYEDEEHKFYIPTPPEKMIMNGESGIITEIHDDHLMLDVGDRVVEVPKIQSVETKKGDLVQISPYRTIDLGFVITTHKSQGSEWPHIIYILNKSTSVMHSRHNFYTAISRARTSVTLVTDQVSLANSVFNTMTPIERRNIAMQKK